MTNQTETAVWNKKRVTLSMIETDLNSGNWDALYYAKESQISRLIDSGRIDEDFGARYDAYQEEMRCLLNEL